MGKLTDALAAREKEAAESAAEPSLGNLAPAAGKTAAPEPEQDRSEPPATVGMGNLFEAAAAAAELGL